MLMPATILICFVSIYPLILGIYDSFTDLKFGKMDSGKFIGLENYIRLFKDPDFYSYISNFEVGEVFWIKFKILGCV